MTEKEVVVDKRLLDYLQTYAREKKLEAPEFYITKACNDGDNYSGLVYRVRIEGIESGAAKCIHAILKTLNLNMREDDLARATIFNSHEIFFYREVLPIFEKTLKGRGGIADLFPTFYDASEESENKVLMLENLSIKGFTMKSSRIMDYPHASLVLKSLGEFHAYSFITRVADPKSFNKLKQMKEPLFTEVQDVQDYIINVCDTVGKILKDEKKHYFERYQQFVDNIMSNLKDAVNGEAAEPYAVVNHGDAWTNNILFKYDQTTQESSQEKKPCDIRLLDFQICRYASPILDIVYLLFCCCTQELRNKYYSQLIDEYYEALSKRIEKSGYDPNILFPREALSEHFIKFGKFAAGMAIFTLHIFSDAKGEYTDMTSVRDPKILEHRTKNDSFYRYMIKGTFNDLVDKNYI